MHVLSIHNAYKIRGGEDESRQAEERLLREHGHRVEVYEEHNDRVDTLSRLQVAAKTIWSREAYTTVTEKLKSRPCDLVHIQNFFPLISPSVHYAAQNLGVPVIQTLRNYRLLCPNGLFFRDGQVCEDCLGKAIPYPGVVHRCYRDSLAASGMTTAMLVVHRMLQTWTNQVDAFITLTEFARQKLIEGGLPGEKIHVKPNFVHPDPGVGTGSGGYAVFVGRLSVEKGLDTLLAAWEKLGGAIPLKIIGDGPLSSEVEAAVDRIPNVTGLGRRPMKEVYDIVGEAKFLVFPSKWYETFGRVAVEAFAKGTPVIAANIGAIAELVEDDRTGLHFQPGNAEDLAATVERAIANPELLQGMRSVVRQEYEQKYTAEANYRRLMEIYEFVCPKTVS